MTLDDIQKYESLEGILEKEKADFPKVFGNNNHIERYNKLKQKFSNYPVEFGALISSINNWMVNLKEQINTINSIADESQREGELSKLFDDDPIIFLNRHDVLHTNKVIEKALEIIKCFNRIDLSVYEIYFLLCSIVVHDIGNIYGRAGHEKRISEILDRDCAEIIPDTVERRIIARISGVHGGQIHGSSDTISILQETTMVNNFIVKEQVLAAILRFADELADDYSRANYDAEESGIIGKNSEIYHIYSQKLHTVKLQKNPVTNSYEVFLAYEFDQDTAKKTFLKAGISRYLLDEIYTRTIKMERERRYCIRYLRPYCSLERIRVKIVITRNAFDEECISYTLEEKGYPDMPFSSIKDISSNIINGKELANKLEGVEL